jgi:spore maturation protein CgeB
MLQTNKYTIACILDTFSYEVFSPEAELVQLTPQDWEKEIGIFKPDMLFVESAWRGKDDLWKDVIKNCPKALRDIVHFCKAHTIPTIFWNKEDPYHFDDFIESAKLFDFVFTTDIECIPRYKKYLNHENIFLLPFACQPKIHNPVEKYERKDAFVFAGAYYKRFPERNEYFRNAVVTLSKIAPLDIYDRHYGNEKTVFKYPELYHPYIRGGLDYNEIDKAYKGYKYALNLNSITTSPTMFSRRVFELVASNTIVINNYSIGIKTLLGDLTISTDNMDKLKEKIKYLQNDQLFEKKLRLLALRKVLVEHTAKVRLDTVLSTVFTKKIHKKDKSVLCLAYIEKDEQLCQIAESFQQQKYSNKFLLFIIKEHVNDRLINDHRIRYIQEADSTDIEVLQEADYIAPLHPEDHYGENYLTDLILATTYCNATIITKGGHYFINDQKKLILDKKQSPYTFSTFAPVRSSIIDINVISDMNIIELAQKISIRVLNNDSIFVIDEFNYCYGGFHYKDISHVNDLKNIDTGITISNKWIENYLEASIYQKKKLLEQSKHIKTDKIISIISFFHHSIKNLIHSFYRWSL